MKTSYAFAIILLMAVAVGLTLSGCSQHEPLPTPKETE